MQKKHSYITQNVFSCKPARRKDENISTDYLLINVIMYANLIIYEDFARHYSITDIKTNHILNINQTLRQ